MKTAVICIDNAIRSLYVMIKKPEAIDSISFQTILSDEEFLSHITDCVWLTDMKNALRELSNKAELLFLSSLSPESNILLGKFLEHNMILNHENGVEPALVNLSLPAEKECITWHRYKTKTSYIDSLVIRKPLIMVLGFCAEDIAVAYSNAIPSIILNEDSEKDFADEVLGVINQGKNEGDKGEKSIDTSGILYTKNWSDISRFLSHLIGDSSEINEICNSHAENYADWLSDLDQKSSLILVVATFCAAIFLNLLVDKNSSPNIWIIISAGIGLLVSLLSMYFAITSFASRVTHGAERIRELLFPACSKKAKHPAAPITDKENVKNSKFAASASAKYLLNRYGTLDYNEIVAKNLLNLRASNYTKIIPEFFSRILLTIAIVLIFLIGVVSVVLRFSISSNPSPDLIADVRIDHIVDGNLYEDEIHVFTSSDFDESLSCLSPQGQQKVKSIVNSIENRSSLFVLLDSSSLGLDNGSVSQYKRKIYITLISEELNALGINMEVVLIND